MELDELTLLLAGDGALPRELAGALATHGVEPLRCDLGDVPATVAASAPQLVVVPPAPLAELSRIREALASAAPRPRLLLLSDGPSAKSPGAPHEPWIGQLDASGGAVALVPIVLAVAEAVLRDPESRVAMRTMLASRPGRSPAGGAPAPQPVVGGTLPLALAETPSIRVCRRSLPPPPEPSLLPWALPVVLGVLGVAVAVLAIARTPVVRALPSVTVVGSLHHVTAPEPERRRPAAQPPVAAVAEADPRAVTDPPPATAGSSVDRRTAEADRHVARGDDARR